MVGDGQILLGGIVGAGEPLQMGPLVPALDQDSPHVDASLGQQAPAAGGVRIEHAPAEETAKPEKYSPHEFQQRGFSRFIRAVEHLDPGAQTLDGDVGEGAKAFDIDPFDEHVGESPKRSASNAL